MMTETTFTLSEVGPSLEAIHRARLWRKIVRLVKENGLCVRHGRDEDTAVLEAVTQAFAASRVCTVAEE
jgi:hypothetical protein